MLKKIRTLRREQVPLSTNSGNENNVAVFNAALHYYRLMERGLIAAGVIKKLIPRQTRLGLLSELRDFSRVRARRFQSG